MKKYSEMTDEELSAAKQALDIEIKKLRASRKDSETTAEKEERVSQIAQMRFAKKDIQAEQDKRFTAPSVEGHVIGAAGIVSAATVGNIGGKAAPKKKSK